MAERQLPKLNVAGSIPVSRSIKNRVSPERCGDPGMHLQFGCRAFSLGSVSHMDAIGYWRSRCGLDLKMGEFYTRFCQTVP